jgi:hypothetical protein
VLGQHLRRIGRSRGQHERQGGADRGSHGGSSRCVGSRAHEPATAS